MVVCFYFREKANTSSKQLRLIPQGTVILSVQRGINSNWQKVITEDGLIVICQEHT